MYQTKPFRIKNRKPWNSSWKSLY